MIATHAGAVAGAWIYYLAIEVSFVADFDAVAIEIFLSFQLFQINWPPEDYDPEDDEIAKVYTNGGKVSCVQSSSS